jgi:putative hydrolase of the HAD superfamily
VIASSAFDGIAAVAFDAVGTLIYPQPAAPVIYAQVGRMHGSQRNIEQIGARFAAAFQQEELHDRQAGFRTSEQRERLRWQRIVSQVLDDVSNPESCFQELFEHFSRPDAWRTNEDAAVTLGRLAAQGLVIAIASNYDHRLRSVAAGKPELRPVAHLIISSEVGWRKPAPQFFRAVSQACQVAPAQIVFIGDDLVNDYQPAQTAGMRPVLLSSDSKAAEQGFLQIGRLAELLPA